MPVPCERGPQISMIGAISTRKVEAALYGEWATNGEIFLTFIEKELSPKLKKKHSDLAGWFKHCGYLCLMDRITL